MEHLLEDARSRGNVSAMSEASEARFKAFRRGHRVVIRGTVRRPAPNLQPCLKRISCTHPRRRAFQLFWQETSEPIIDATEFEHIEPEIPEFIEAILIHMPDDSVFWIQSTRPPEPKERKQRR